MVANLFVKPSDAVRDVIATIDSMELQIALVVDESSRLLGTVTDGDVRRGLLRGVTLEATADKVMNPSPLVATQDMRPSAIEALMQRHDVRRIPIVDSDGVVRDLAVPQREARPDAEQNHVVLMAGGLGSRLAELTRDCPKPLLKVGSKPILETILERFVAQGFRRFSISVNYRAEMIESYFGDGSRWGADIEYLREDERLGTAGALNLLPSRPTEPMLVMNGDLLTNLDFRSMLHFHRDLGARATMAVREFDMQVPFGVVDLDGHYVRRLDEKPVHRFFVNAGIYVLDPECLDYVPPGSYVDMPDVFAGLMDAGHAVGSFPIHEYWMDVGRINDYEEANASYATQFPD